MCVSEDDVKMKKECLQKNIYTLVFQKNFTCAEKVFFSRKICFASFFFRKKG